MLKETKVKLIGTAPLLMHNGLMADQSSSYAIESKKVSGKTKKTEADYEALAEMEWFAGLYTKNDVIVVPGIVLETAIKFGARKTKKGKDVECGLFIKDDVPVQFSDDKKPLEWLYKSGKYIDQRMVGLRGAGSKKRIKRTRPRFDHWALEFTIQYDDEIITSESVLMDWIDTCGGMVGICDFRPRFGRFERVS
jgi:hypothetical protein